jgi:AcrR family transcriptional regulator
MVRDADRTKKRLLEAATAEFAALGIAGARVDRIAEAAGCNKAMIYAYFGNKDQLFDAVFTALVAATVEHVPFDATDLPGYAGRLFDRYEDDRATVRLATWYRLERPQGAPLQAIVTSNIGKLEKVARAQGEGVLSDHYTPVELLTLVISIAGAWASVTPELGTNAPADRARRRRTVVDAVRRLIADGPDAAHQA